MHIVQRTDLVCVVVNPIKISAFQLILQQKVKQHLPFSLGSIVLHYLTNSAFSMITHFGALFASEKLKSFI